MRDASPVPAFAALAVIAAAIFLGVRPQSAAIDYSVEPPPVSAGPVERPECEGDARARRRKDARSNIVFLVDTSGTFHQSGAFSIAVDRVEQLGYAIAEGNLPKPIQIYVSPVGESSNSREAVCDIHIPTTNFFARDCPQDSMAYQMDGCVGALRKLRRDNFTEIGPALDRAVRQLGLPTAIVRSIILISDMEEDLRPGLISGDPDLSETCLLGVYEILENDPGWQKRVRFWEERLKNLGATTKFQPLLGLKYGSAVEFLRECSGK